MLTLQFIKFLLTYIANKFILLLNPIVIYCSIIFSKISLTEIFQRFINFLLMYEEQMKIRSANHIRLAENVLGEKKKLQK